MYDALILVNGEIPDKEHWLGLPFRLLVCTDGAANILKNFTRTPDIIIGDMDSIAESPQNATLNELKLLFPRSKIISLNDQNSTDFEKALFYAQENKMTTLICVGILGKSADHSVYNLSLLVRFAEDLQLIALSAHDKNCQWIFPLRKKTTVQTLPAQTLSFLAFPEATLSTRGLKWELNETRLTQVHQHSVRNQTLQETIHIEAAGHCLAFLTSFEAPIITY